MKTLFFLASVIFVFNQADGQLRVFPDGNTSLGTIESYPGYRLGIKAQKSLSAFATFTDDPTNKRYLHAHTSYTNSQTTKNWVIDYWDASHSVWFENYYVYSSGQVCATSFYSLSDSSFKHEIVPMHYSQSKFMQLQPKSYKLKMDGDNAEIKYGFIAQEVKEVFPNIVSVDTTGKHSLDYNQIIPLLTLAIQSQQYELDSLKSLINELLSNQNMSEKALVISQKSNMSILSNPVQGVGYISYEFPEDEKDISFRLVDMNGNIISARALYQSKGLIELNANEYPAGNYIAYIFSGDKKLSSQKIILQ
jgi:hypothetical protein